MQKSNGLVPVDGTSLYYEMTGEGDPVIFLHGMTLDLRMWDRQVASLRDSYRVVRYDMRGFGRSEPSTVPYSHAADLQALIEHLGLEMPVLVGLSMGGGAVINHAILYPGQARALVAICPSLGGYQRSKEFTDYQMALLQATAEGGIDAGKDLWISGPLFDQLRDKPAGEQLRTMVGEYSGWHWTHPDPGVPLVPPAIERLEEIAVPSLIIIGEKDVPDCRAVADILVQRIAHAERLVFEEAGHMVNMEQPEKFNRSLQSFLQTIFSRAESS
jgi:3-oxoadipate enol-lactonase